jgi:hypothetical protein
LQFHVKMCIRLTLKISGGMYQLLQFANLCARPLDLDVRWSQAWSSDGRLGNMRSLSANNLIEVRSGVTNSDSQCISRIHKACL